MALGHKTDLFQTISAFILADVRLIRFAMSCHFYFVLCFIYPDCVVFLFVLLTDISLVVECSGGRLVCCLIFVYLPSRHALN